MKTREELEHRVSMLMMLGLGLSMILLASSITLSFFSAESSNAGHSENLGLLAPWSWVLRLGIEWESLAIAGVLVLIATPVIRVLFCLHHFAAVRDWKYIILTIWVLFGMVLGVVLGAA